MGIVFLLMDLWNFSETITVQTQQWDLNLKTVLLITCSGGATCTVIAFTQLGVHVFSCSVPTGKGLKCMQNYKYHSYWQVNTYCWKEEDDF